MPPPPCLPLLVLVLSLLPTPYIFCLALNMFAAHPRCYKIEPFPFAVKTPHTLHPGLWSSQGLVKDDIKASLGADNVGEEDELRVSWAVCKSHRYQLFRLY